MYRVGYFTPMYFDDASTIGGGERYPHNLARGVNLASNGEFRVEIVSYGPTAAEKMLEDNVRLRVLPVVGPPPTALDPASWDIPEAVASYDLIHLHQLYTRPSELVLLAAQWFDRPICGTDHGGETSSLGRENGALELFDHLTAYSDFGASQHKTTTPVTVIKGGLDAAEFKPPAQRPARDRFLYVGRLLPHKGIDRLIRALPENLRLTVCGRPYHTDYFTRLQELARGKQVDFETEASDTRIRDLYARAWATILPSVYRDCYGTGHRLPELMGFTLLESMALGTPGICSRVGAMPEFVRPGETGYIFDSEADLTSQLQQLAGDAALVERMGQKAREVVVEEYDIRVCGRKMADVYRQVFATRAARSRQAA